MYRGREGQWAFLLHRLSGLAILFYLMLHVFSIGSFMFGERFYMAIHETYDLVPFRIGLLFVTAGVVYHAFNGLRINMMDFTADVVRRAGDQRAGLRGFGVGGRAAHPGRVLMIRARTFTDARQQAHSNAELNWWIFMRISGLILVFLILGHIYMTFIQVSESDATFDAVVNKLASPAWKFYDWLILTLSLLHGANGARYSIEDYVRSRPNRAWVKGVFYTVIALLFTFGTVGLFSI
jgi:succinate dehydrogenase / fumarate reductase membrane anchor subunit